MVTEFFALFTDIPDTEIFKWEPLCRRAAASISKRLKPGADVSNNQETLCAAAAGQAYYEYVMLGAGGATATGDEIRVGDITLRSSGADGKVSPADAAGIRDHFLSACAGLIVSDSGCFISAGGGAVSGES